MDISDIEIVEDSVGGLEADLRCGEDAGEKRSEFVVEGLELLLASKEFLRLVVGF